MTRTGAALVAFGLAALPAWSALAEPAGPATPPPPWFVVADIPSHDPAFTTTRLLWNREAGALRYCRKDKLKDEYACAGDVTLPQGRWVLQRIQDQPESGVACSARFYSPDRDQTLQCRAGDHGDFSCG